MSYIPRSGIGEETKEIWDERLAKDAVIYGFPINMIGRKFTFIVDLGKGRMAKGTITGLQYDDDWMPVLEISNQSFAGFEDLRLQRSSKKEGADCWTLVGSVAKSAPLHLPGFLFFDP